MRDVIGWLCLVGFVGFFLYAMWITRDGEGGPE